MSNDGLMFKSSQYKVNMPGNRFFCNDYLAYLLLIFVFTIFIKCQFDENLGVCYRM